jgi:hypothetical protein
VKRAIFAIALAAAPLFADEIRLQGGGRLTGQILEQTEESVTIDIGAGKMTVKMSTVVGIDQSTSPLQEYRERAAKLAEGDVEGWRALGRWATKQGLGAQSREAFSRVRAAKPDDPEASRALGLVLYNGKWVTEEESYRAQGFVDLDGEWMAPAERQAILDEQRVRDEANRQTVAAEVQASQAALNEQEAKKKAEDAAAHSAFLNDTLPKLGDPPAYWGYGYGPAVWPVQPGLPGRGQ